jgi:putative membrane protein
VILATLDAILNAAALICLCAGYYFIRKKQIQRHRRAMLTAFVLSIGFLITYLAHHALDGSVPFRHPGPLRTLYFAILIPHVLLAAAIVPLAIVTLRRGLALRIVDHRRIARITLPIWVYVSFTGVIVYLMLYHL